jgi:hypothetical protein
VLRNEQKPKGKTSRFEDNISILSLNTSKSMKGSHTLCLYNAVHARGGKGFVQTVAGSEVTIPGLFPGVSRVMKAHNNGQRINLQAHPHIVIRRLDRRIHRHHTSTSGYGLTMDPPIKSAGDNVSWG